MPKIDQYKTGLFTKRYREHEYEEPVLTIGTTSFSRNKLTTELGVSHIVAAQDLTRIFKRMQVQTAMDVLRIPMMDWARVNGMGEAKLRLILELLIWWEIDDAKIERWIDGALHGDRLRQWVAICREAGKKAKKKTGGQEV